MQSITLYEAIGHYGLYCMDVVDFPLGYYVYKAILFVI